MNLTKEGWWEVVKLESLSHIDNNDLLAAFEQVFYTGYNCKQVEDEIIRSQLDILRVLVQ